jgi:hypothetical protein
MMLFAKDPVEYWQNSNRGVYRVTTQYIFNRMFDRNRIAPKAMMSTGASGMAHALMCPGITLPGAFLLTALFGASGLIVAALQRIGRRPISAMWADVPDGTLRNALVIGGVAATFFLMSIPRASFLLFVGGATPAEWMHLMKLLFVRG